MPTHTTIPRTGQRHLVFDGDRLATATSLVLPLVSLTHNRWWELALYRHTDGRHIATASYRTQWDAEHPHDSAHVATDLDQAFAWLEAIDPLAHVRGYPDAPHYQAKNAQLQVTIRAHYARAITALADELGLVEHL